MRRLLILLLLLLPARAAAQACDDGCFEARMSGAPAVTLRGSAMVWSGDADRFSMLLTDDGASSGAILFERAAGAPQRAATIPVGAHCSDAAAARTSFAVTWKPAGGDAAGMSGGSVIIRTASADRIAGTFSVTFCGSDTPPRTITGSFDARRFK